VEVVIATFMVEAHFTVSPGCLRRCPKCE